MVHHGPIDVGAKRPVMDDDARAVLDEIFELLPPRTTVYRSSAAAPVADLSFPEPATEPIRLPASPLPTR